MNVFVVYKKSNNKPFSFLNSSISAADLEAYKTSMPDFGVSSNSLDIEASDPDSINKIVITNGAATIGELTRDNVDLRDLREIRDKKLAETDWWAVSDRTMSQAQLDYRQALRDITKSYSSLTDVVWPIRPV